MGANADVPVEPGGYWREKRPGCLTRQGAPALFVDRDGTIIDLVDYIADAEAVSLVPGAADTLRLANQADMPVILVTNQSGIGRGYYDWRAFAAVQDRMHDLLAKCGARIDGVYACPAVADSGDTCRKPNPGMLLAAAKDFGIELPRSWIAGDAASDLEAGRRAGLCHGWLVPTGYGARDAETARGLALAEFHVTVGSDITALGPAFMSSVA